MKTMTEKLQFQQCEIINERREREERMREGVRAAETLIAVLMNYLLIGREKAV